MTRSILVTGASGYIGELLVAELARHREPLQSIIASDLHSPSVRHDGVHYVKADIRDEQLVTTLTEHSVEVVVHLAAVVTPGRKPDRALEYSVDVGGTRNVLRSCHLSGVRKVIVASSGAAYGYHADNPGWIDEDTPLRGNPSFAYSNHKRIVEEMLARWRSDHPDLDQLIFRPGTILGERTRNQITDIFDRRVIVGLTGTDSPFVFIWDADVVACLVQGIHTDAVGVYNLAGDGALSMRSIAKISGKPYVAIPPSIVGSALGVMKRFGVTQYGPEQVDFLRYRPVLSNSRLKSEFGYTPRRTSEDTFRYFVEARRGQA